MPRIGEGKGLSTLQKAEALQTKHRYPYDGEKPAEDQHSIDTSISANQGPPPNNGRVKYPAKEEYGIANITVGARPVVMKEVLIKEVTTFLTTFLLSS